MKKYKMLTEQEMDLGRKRFKQLLEYSYISNEGELLLDEDDNEELNPEDKQIGGDEVSDLKNTQPNDMGVDQGDISDEMGGGDPLANEIPDVESESDEVEIDVTELTDSQEIISDKVEQLANETSKVYDVLSNLTDKLEQMVNNSNDKINKLEDEIIKRNPTPVEKLQKQVVLSNPFNETPEGYWEKKEKEGNYKLVDDDNQEKEYTITPRDLDVSNREVYKTFGIEDDEFNQNLNTIFNF